MLVKRRCVLVGHILLLYLHTGRRWVWSPWSFILCISSTNACNMHTQVISTNTCCGVYLTICEFAMQMHQLLQMRKQLTVDANTTAHQSALQLVPLMMMLTYWEGCRAARLQHTQQRVLQVWVICWLAALNTLCKLAGVVALLTYTVSAPTGFRQRHSSITTISILVQDFDIQDIAAIWKCRQLLETKVGQQRCSPKIPRPAGAEVVVKAAYYTRVNHPQLSPNYYGPTVAGRAGRNKLRKGLCCSPHTPMNSEQQHQHLSTINLQNEANAAAQRQVVRTRDAQNLCP